MAIALFYTADLATMHVLPVLTGTDKAMEVIEVLHRNFNWIVILFAVVSIAIGFVELFVELRKRETRVRRLIDANIIGVFLWGRDGRVDDANEAFLRICGYSRKGIIAEHLHLSELISGGVGDSDKQSKADVREAEYLHKDGTRVPVLFGFTRFDEAGGEGVAFVLDLSDLKRAEAEARENERRFREAQAELAHASRVMTMRFIEACSLACRPLLGELSKSDRRSFPWLRWY